MNRKGFHINAKNLTYCILKGTQNVLAKSTVCQNSDPSITDHHSNKPFTYEEGKNLPNPESDINNFSLFHVFNPFSLKQLAH